VTHTPNKGTGCPPLGFGLERGIRSSEGVSGATSRLGDPAAFGLIDGFRALEGYDWAPLLLVTPAPLRGVDPRLAP
jgi:hypothetical protein